MKGRLVLVLCLLLLLSCLFCARFGQPQPRASSILPVHNLSTSLNYSTIQEAINANETTNGQTIIVDAGTYIENVVVNKSISLIGANSESTIINGNGTGNVVEIDAENVTISGFTITDSNDTQYGYGYAGILVDGDNACLSENIMTDSYAGIFILGDGCLVTGNEISNDSIGLFIHTATNVTVTANTIANNNQGIHSEFAEGNTYFHNNIINNSLQVYNWGESGEWPNTWDNGNSSGGNYWSDYNGTNANNDGFGATPYNIGPLDVGNIDHYPLMGMFSDFNVLQNVDVQIVSNSTISDFQFNGTAVSFNAAGENGTTGFCRISIPTAVINGALTVFVNGTEVPYTLLPESNSTQSYLYLTYQHSPQLVVAPEFPSFTVLTFFMMSVLIAIAFYRKKVYRTEGSSQAEIGK